jgi:hypothetical protein
MPDPMNTKITTNHDAIKSWTEERGGKPAVNSEKSVDSKVLEIDFDKKGSKSLKQVSWNEFFKDFDEENMAFLYQDKTLEGKNSTYYRLIFR